MKLRRFAGAAAAASSLLLCMNETSRADETCAKVVNINGDSCETLKFDLDLDSCPSKTTIGKTTVQCASDSATLGFKTATHSYKVRLSRGSEAWGRRAWSLGNVIQTARTATTAKIEKDASARSRPLVIEPQQVSETSSQSPKTDAIATDAMATREPAATAGVPINPAESQQASATPAALRGYVDAQYRWIKGDDANSGFVINDGAVIISHSAGATEALIDIPFRFEGVRDGNPAVDSDGDGDPANDGDLATNTFQVATRQAQAWVQRKFGDTTVRLGQFDTIYGFELNDAPDFFFTQWGIVFNAVAPITHTGALVTHTTSGGFTARLLAANNTNQGAKGESNPEYGVQFQWADQNYRASAGWLGLERRKGDGGIKEKAFRHYVDLLGGLTFGDFTLDVQIGILREPGTNTGAAYLIVPTYAVTPEWVVGLRYEFLSHVPGLGDDGAGNSIYRVIGYETTQWTIGTQYRLSDSLRVKLDFTYRDGKETKDSDHFFDRRSALAGVYNF